MARRDLSYLTADPAMRGMPPELAATAQRNLAVVDANLATVNAVRSNVSTQTTPLPPMATESAAAPIGYADSLLSPTHRTVLDAPVQQQPGGELDIDTVNQRRNQILQGVDPDRPAIFIDKHRKRELLGELGVLTGIARQHSLEQAHLADESLQQQKDIEASTSYASFANAVSKMKSRRGTAEWRDEFAQIALDNDMGLTTPKGQKLAGMLVDGHQEMWQLRQAHQKTQEARMQKQAEDIAKAPEEAKKTAAEELKSIHKTTPTELLNATSVEYGTTDDKGNFKPDEGGKTGGNVARINVGHGVPVTMPAASYYQYKTMFGEKPDNGPKAITPEEYEALPSGSTYTAPDGKKRKKP